MDVRPPARSAAVAAVAILALAACSSLPNPLAQGAGTPLDPGPPPDPGACAARLRAEADAAARIRADLGATVPGLGADPASVQAAATDPTATTEALGVPLTAEEDAALREAGLAIDEMTPMATWVNVGKPDAFGGVWIDPPGSDRLVVAIRAGDRDTLALARCLERPGLDVRYVTATRSGAELTELQERITADWQSGALDALGIEVVSTAQVLHEGAMVVEIGVRDPTDAQRAALRDRYGPDVIVVDSEPPQPAGYRAPARRADVTA